VVNLVDPIKIPQFQETQNSFVNEFALDITVQQSNDFSPGSLSYQSVDFDDTMPNNDLFRTPRSRKPIFKPYTMKNYTAAK
jgi:hypothetical protein